MVSCAVRSALQIPKDENLMINRRELLGITAGASATLLTPELLRAQRQQSGKLIQRAKTWGQFFLKYVVSHPAVIAVRAGTSKATHMLDNLGRGIGRLQNEAMRERMAKLVDAWPPAPGRGRGAGA